MKALFKRDFYLLKTQVWFFLAVFAGLTTILLLFDKVYLLPGKLTGITLCFYLSITQDEQNNFSRFEKSLPIGGTRLTLFRYLSGFGVCLMALAAGGAIAFVLRFLFQVPVDTGLMVKSFGETFVCVAVLLFLLIPLLVQLGAQKLPVLLFFAVAVWLGLQFATNLLLTQLQNTTQLKCFWLFFVMVLVTGFCKSFEKTHETVLNQ